jgi:hypothetical protein
MSPALTTHRDLLEDELREHLGRLIAITRPYAMSRGRFHDIHDVAEALGAAGHELECAEVLIARLKRPVR